MTPFFSVVMPTFNRRELLKRSIGSVVKQNFNYWELIVVDDGSTDDTSSLLNDYSSKDQRIKYYNRPSNRKKGASTCRNIGVELSKGQFVAFLDSDDEWFENKLENDYEIIQSKVDIMSVYSDCIINDGKKEYRAPSRHLNKGESYVDLLFSGENLNATPTYVIRKNVLEEMQFDENLDIHEDRDLFIRIGNKYGWTHISQPNTLIHWEGSRNSLKGFASMISYYQKYSPAVSNSNYLANYLRWAWVCAARFNPSYKGYFYGELKRIYPRIDLKYKVFVLFPEFLFWGWKVLRKLRTLVH